ncbi:hypothetical protein [Rhodoblastus sp.]|uniref:hypothetical protein n=1 Tax=Rhodoblastus sp. TaxID=1962975 RepID=UPI0025F1D673|nr:hypothetical protein [Rhodoblastus sp.]
MSGGTYSAAYSKDLGELITADDAYSYRSQDLISSNDGFECASDSCQARLMCINIDSPPASRILEPYFRIAKGAAHDPRCPYSPPETVVGRQDKDKEFIKKVKCGHDDVVFLEVAPIRSPRSVPPGQSPIITKKSTSTPSTNPTGQSLNISRYNRVRPLVMRFKKMSTVQAGSTYVHIGAERIAYSDLFFNLNTANHDLAAPERRVIFWGVGFINTLQNGDYQLKFRYPQTLSGKNDRPNVYINRSELDVYMEKNILSQIIAAGLAAAGQRVEIFVYAEPVLARSGTQIYLRIASLDHLYFVPH